MVKIKVDAEAVLASILALMQFEPAGTGRQSQRETQRETIRPPTVRE